MILLPKTVHSSETLEHNLQQQTNILLEYWNSIDWKQIFYTSIIATIKILIIFILFFIAKRIGNRLIKSSFNRQKNRANNPIRVNTIQRIIVNIYNAILVFLVVFSILETIGVPVGSLVAGAGVIGLAFSLGAQDFVSDIVNGFMIMIEGQIDIGDQVIIDGTWGTIADSNLKTTKVKGFDGSIYYIPNRKIDIICNRSKENMRADIYVRLYPDTNIAKVRSIIQQVNQEKFPDYPAIVGNPHVIILPMDNGQISLRVDIFTKPGHEFDVQWDFFEYYISRLTAEGIDLPSNTLDVTPPKS